MGRGHKFNIPTARKTRQHKKKTRLNFEFTHCIYMLNNEITKTSKIGFITKRDKIDRL